ncbi:MULTISPECIES: peptidase inhibitor family I36 protein [unclassified Streptomyces]|uniref:peptidase inhibitor family I36 protein n=1 Tax=unclassified Streptomyces TaxID=2593676 RepID=UPI001F046215|nr:MULTISPECIES: peptidase inhibitor family I36 protein [unclassified Streptomyces]MCH0564138.1 peptidase inhibitor family I36 protein [Streptomyces sp. MUM 2J]MCH0568441.1 peptidase inhibitor family I36 protein [Streptomyces sp. MUM 136J]
MRLTLRRHGRATPLFAVLAVSAAAATALAVPTSASAAPDTATSVDCASGDVCFWTGFNFTGKRCAWSVADPDWQNGAIRCSWAATENVKSVWNAGTGNYSGVAYYTGANYSNRIGCTRQQQGGNLAGTYKVRSHKWISGSCG